jgi:hypothetical protein
MAKKQEDPSLEIFANLRTILVFVIIGSSIAGYVEYHSQASATKTHDKWRFAIDDKVKSDSYLTLNEFKDMISGYPITSKSQSDVIMSRKEEESSESEEGEEPEKKKKRKVTKKKAVSKYIDYTWDGLFSTSVIKVQMSNEEGQEETYVYRISEIQH